MKMVYLPMDLTSEQKELIKKWLIKTVLIDKILHDKLIVRDNEVPSVDIAYILIHSLTDHKTPYGENVDELRKEIESWMKSVLKD